MLDRCLTKIIIHVLIPVDEHTIMKVKKELDKVEGIDACGYSFRYTPPIGEDEEEVYNGR